MKKIKIKTVDGKVIVESKAKGMTIKELAEKYRDELAYAYLSCADLSGSNLSCADLSNSDLSYACLTGSDLTGVDLSGSFLFQTDLAYACLSGSNLTGANLSGANLFQANLSFTNLSFANLDNTKLTGIEGYSDSREIFLELCRRQLIGTFNLKELAIIGQLSPHHPCWDEIKRRYGKTALSIAKKLAKAGWDEYYKKYKEVLK